MATEIAQAYVALTTKMPNLKKDIASEFGGAADAINKQGTAAFSGLFKSATKLAAGAATAMAGYFSAKKVFGGGMARLMGIEEAQAKMRGLGHDSAAVDKIMSNALASVKGTSFGMAEAATTAAGAVAAGIEPGERLEKVLKSVSNSAAAAGVDMGEMGSIYNKVASTGKAGNDVLQQVANRGLPIYQKLAEQMGVTTDEVFAMASAGKIGFAEFEQAMTSAAGTVAFEMGTTLRGSLANLNSSLSRIGANLLQGVFPLFGEGIRAVTKALGPVEDGAKRLGAAFGEHLTGAIESTTARVAPFSDAFGTAWRINDGGMAGAVAGLEQVAFKATIVGKEMDSKVGGALANVGTVVMTTAVPALREAMDASEALGASFRAAWTESGGGLAGFLDGVDAAITRLGIMGAQSSSPLGGMLTSLSESALTAFRFMREAGEMLWDALGDTLTAIIPMVSEAAKAFSPLQLAMQVLTPILPVVAEALATVAGVISGALSSVLPIVSSLMQSLAETLSGALATALPVLAGLFAQVAEVLAGTLAGALPALIELLGSLASALSGTLASVLPTIASVIETLADVLSGALAAVLPIVVDLISSLAETLAGTLSSILPTVARLVETLADALAAVLPIVLPIIVRYAGLLADALGGYLAALLPTLVQMVDRLATSFADVLPVILPLVDAILDGLMGAIEALLPPAMRLIEAVLPVMADLLDMLLPIITPLISIIAGALVGAVNMLAGALDFVIPVVGALMAALTWLMDTGRTVSDALVAAWDAVRNGFQVGWDWIKSNVVDMFVAAWNATRDAFVAVKDRVVGAWNTLRDNLASAYATIKTAVFDAFKERIEWVRDRFIDARDRISSAWEGLKSALNVVGDWISTNVFDPLKNAVSKVADAFGVARDAIKVAWDKVANIAREPVHFIVDTVYNNGIKKVFNNVAGAVGLSSIKLPDAPAIKSYARGTEDHRAQIAHAGAMRLWAEPETGGEAYIPLAAAKRARSTRLLAHVADRFGYALTPFADGGIVPATRGFGEWIGGKVSDIWNGAKGLVVNVANFLKNPVEGFKQAVINPMVEKLTGSGGGDFGKIMGGIPKKVIGAVVDHTVGLIRKKNEDEAGAGRMPDSGPVGPLPGTGGFHRPMHGGRVTSNFGPRWGSFHNGIDLAGGGNTFAAWGGQVRRVGWNVGYGNTGIGVLIAHANGLETYYGHNPSLSAVAVRAGQTVAAGQRVGREGATGNVTGVHLHFSVFKGGRAINPRSVGVFDSGGWLKPGHMAYNAGTKPEAVLNPRESAAYVQRGASGAGMSEGDLRALRDLLMEAMDAHPATRIAESLGDAVSTSGRRRASMRGA